jgi:hypothetical protein
VHATSRMANMPRATLQTLIVQLSSTSYFAVCCTLLYAVC